MQETAPIVLFVYNRLWHTRQVIEALQKNKLSDESQLFIFSDAARSAQELEAVNEVRSFISTISGFKNLTIVHRKENFGLAQSIISGVTEIIKKFDRAIVLEDDLLTSPYFLQYMNDALDMYQDEEQVASIHGYLYPVGTDLPSTFFIRGADCWGWATWKRAWDFFDEDGSRLLTDICKQKLGKQFDFSGTAQYQRMLEDQIQGKNDSWAIRWYAAAFLRNMLTLYPNVSLVENIGRDNSGSHFGETSDFEVSVSEKSIKLYKQPAKECSMCRKAFEDYFRISGVLAAESLYKRIRNKIRKILK